jgi:parvulin-like peptidyl-prolyl isomerase
MRTRRILTILPLLLAACAPARAPGEAGERVVAAASSKAEAGTTLEEDLPLLEVNGRTIGSRELEVRSQLLSQTASLRMGEPSQRSSLLRSMLQVELMANAATAAGLVGEHEERLLLRLLPADWQLRRVGMDAVGEQRLSEAAVRAAFDGSGDAGPELREARVIVLPTAAAADEARAEMQRLRRESSKLDEEIFVEVCRARSIDPAARAADCATGPIARASDGATTNRALSDALFALPKSGRVSPIYRTARGWEMVQLIRVISPLSGGLEAARPLVVERAVRDGRAEASARWLSELAARQPAQVDGTAVSALSKARAALEKEPAAASMVARRYEAAGLAEGPRGVLTLLELTADEKALKAPFANPAASPAAWDGSGSGGE